MNRILSWLRRRSPKLDDGVDYSMLIPEKQYTPEELATIVKDHAAWAQSVGKDGALANFRNADLKGVDFQGADLRWADFRGAHLQHANLKSADLFRANLHGAFLADANLQGAKLLEADLHDARFGGANLRKAWLAGANLRGARLFNACLQGAVLVEANLLGANLSGANLEGEEATEDGPPGNDLPGANLAEANLRDSVLNNAKLTDVRGLRPDQLGGSTLTNATLPPDIAKFEGLEFAAETSRNARKIFLILLLGSIYSWLTVATTNDLQLLLNSVSTPLPIIQTEVLIKWFYWGSPILLIGIYIYFHLYLHRLWHNLAALPAVFPDGKDLHDRAYPWLLNGLVASNFSALESRRTAISYLQNGVSIALAWWVVPVTLLVIWIRYLPKQDWIGSSIQIICIIIAFYFGGIFYNLACRTLRGVKTNFLWTKIWKDSRAYFTVIFAFFALSIVGISWSAIHGVRTNSFEILNGRTWAPYLFEKFGYDVFANLRESKISQRPDDYWQIRPENRIEAIAGGDLTSASLRYADVSGAFVDGADLRNADLTGANLGYSSLRGARLNGATVVNANLEHTDLRQADLTRAELQGSDLHRAKLDGANLNLANLEGVVGLSCQQLWSAEDWCNSHRDMTCQGNLLLMPISIDRLRGSNPFDCPDLAGDIDEEPVTSED